MNLLKAVIEIVLLFAIISFGIGFVMKDTLPSQDKIVEEMYKEPVQEEIQVEPFEIEREGFTYTIFPRYSYELYGLVVADYDSENWLDVNHEKDPLNTKDICAVWGDNIESGVYLESKFSHGEFTCYWRSKDEEAYQKYVFSGSHISNSHLLPENDLIYTEIKKADIDDQVHFKGYLADYLIEFEGKQLGRTTSITRGDTGNGACEVVFVTDFKILKKSGSIYLAFYRYSRYIIGFCLVLLILVVFLRPIGIKQGSVDY